MKKIKILNYITAGSIIIFNINPIFANNSYDEKGNTIGKIIETININGEKSSETFVYAEVGSEFKVTIPKSLTLSGITKTGNYEITIEGDIAGSEYITIIPDETFTLNSIGLNNIVSTVTQDIIRFRGNDYEGILLENEAKFEDGGKGTILAPDLTAGRWEGTFYFNINLKNNIYDELNDDIEYTAFTLTANNYDMVGISKSGDVVIPETFEYEGVNYKINEIGDEVFYNCENLTSVNIPNSVTHIGDSVFYGCENLTNVNIPNGVISLGDYIFTYCSNLTSIKIPESVKNIGNYLFYGCTNLESIEVDDKNLVYDSRNNCNAIIKSNDKTLIYGCQNTIIPKDIDNIGEYAFYGCTNLNSLEIPDNIINIGEGAFYGCESLNSLEIPFNVKSINKYTFYGCENLKDIYIPDSIINIEQYAFVYCSSLTSIEIPKSVENIGHYLFYGCTNLTNIKVDEENPIYDSRNNCNAIIKTATDTLYVGCKNTIIPDDIINIGDNAFYGCENLISINIPSGVLHIGEYAFYNCLGLTSITLPINLTNISEGAFECCTYLKTINYMGTNENWNKITKDTDWNKSCPKDMKIIYNYTE